MNVKLKQNFTFTAGVYMDGTLDMFNFHVVLSLITESHNQDDTMIALDRIREFVDQMASTVFINREDADTVRALNNLGFNITTLPEDPVDQVVGVMLHCKLNAIVEGRMLITTTEITTDNGAPVTFVQHHDDELGPFTDTGWWNDNTLQHREDSLSESDNVVIIHGTSGWNDLGLAWSDDDDTASDNTVVFANFDKYDSK